MSNAHSLFRGGLFVSILFLGLSALCFGQATSSAISGVVRDPSQAVIAGATVTVTNTGTGMTRRVQSDSGGRYRAGELQPGTYQVTVTMSGFTSQTHRGVELLVGQEQVLNFSLEIGAVEQLVEVTAAAPVVETTTATVSGGVTQEQLRELPLNGRSFTELVTLQAGAVAPTNAVSRGAQTGNAPQLSISGSRPDANNFMLDGTDMSHPTGFTPGSAAGVQLGVDTIREYQVITSNAKAEYGRNAGGIVNAVSRSGTNEWHGSAFEFLRNNKLDARNFYDVGEKPPFKRNQFGATFGGPIWRDQTFFYLGYEGLRQRLTDTVIFTVPTADARQGIGVLGPGDVVDPRIAPYMALHPLPNSRLLSPLVGELVTTTSRPTTENFGSARIDHQFSQNDFLFGRYTPSRGEKSDQDSLLVDLIFETSNHYATLQYDHIFSPTVLNTARIGLNRSVIETGLTQIPGAGPELDFVPGQRFNQFSIGGYSALGNNYTTNPIFWANTIFQYEDQLSVTRGAHTMKFGAMVQRYRFNTDGSVPYGGSFGFGTLRTALLAGPSDATIRVLLPGSISYRHFRTTLLGFFAQDDYRVTQNLMLNYGLRWEFTTGMSETDDLQSFLQRGPFESTFDDLGVGKFYDNHIGMVGPRVGFNWALGAEQKTSISGGFGAFYNQILSNGVITYRIQQPWYKRAQESGLNVRESFPNIVQVALDNDLLSRESRHFDHENFKTPTLYRYNLTIQRALPGQMSLRVGYVGALGRHIQREQGLNSYPIPVPQPDGSLFFPGPPVAQRINPAFDSLPYMSSDANSTYSALQTSLRKQFSAGLMFQANYTWSKCLDDFSNNDSSIEGISRRGQFGPDRTLDRGRCLFDVPQRFVFNGVYELPIGSGKRWMNTGGIANTILGGWQIGGIISVQQGVPFTALSNVRGPGFQFVAPRPNLVLGTDVPALTENGTPERFFDPSGFTAPPWGTIGNAARGLMLGPNLRTVNVGLSKSFVLREGTNLQFRSEFFNLFNRANFANPAANVFRGASGSRDATAGRITSTSTTSRQLQFGLKLTF